VTPERTKEKPAPPSGTKKPDYNVLDATLRAPLGSQRALELGEILVPDYAGQSFRRAVDDSIKLGLEPISVGSGRVVAQSPPPGTPVRPGTEIRLTLSLQR